MKTISMYFDEYKTDLEYQHSEGVEWLNKKIQDIHRTVFTVCDRRDAVIQLSDLFDGDDLDFWVSMFGLQEQFELMKKDDLS